mmetsp:Transcript_13876/g.37745  ORF Transcript_13876/g.37745 Transcript_13876/m.37745 type:complete len:441 (-) Transcript_13876:141-1463(-)
MEMAHRFAPYGVGAGEDARCGGFKTRMCSYFERGGACPRGDACSFAHGAHELQGAEDSSPEKFKTVMCTYWSQTGTCGRGDRCTFAHGVEEMRGDGFKAAAMAHNFKTQLCVYFMDQGVCVRGVACSFAHGHEELQTPGSGIGNHLVGAPPAVAAVSMGCTGQVAGVPTAFPFKTKLCTHFESGFCSRGAACTFAHGKEELGTVRPSGPPGLLQAVAGNRNMPTMPALGGPSQPPRPESYKKKLCSAYQELAMCPDGDECDLAHGIDELKLHLFAPRGAISCGAGPRRKGSMGMVGADGMDGTGGMDGMKGSGCKGPGGFKTVLCRYFMELGTCSRGEACTFAHGPQEVPGYKTKPCKWHVQGFCNRGALCPYTHGEEELTNESFRQEFSELEASIAAHTDMDVSAGNGKLTEDDFDFDFDLDRLREQHESKDEGRRISR